MAKPRSTSRHRVKTATFSVQARVENVTPGTVAEVGARIGYQDLNDPLIHDFERLAAALENDQPAELESYLANSFEQRYPPSSSQANGEVPLRPSQSDLKEAAKKVEELQPLLQGKSAVDEVVLERQLTSALLEDPMSFVAPLPEMRDFCKAIIQGRMQDIEEEYDILNQRKILEFSRQNRVSPDEAQERINTILYACGSQSATAFFYACYAKNADEVIEGLLVLAGNRCNPQDLARVFRGKVFRFTPLMFACHLGNFEAAKTFLKIETERKLYLLRPDGHMTGSFDYTTSGKSLLEGSGKPPINEIWTALSLAARTMSLENFQALFKPEILSASRLSEELFVIACEIASRGEVDFFVKLFEMVELGYPQALESLFYPTSFQCTRIPLQLAILKDHAAMADCILHYAHQCQSIGRILDQIVNYRVYQDSHTPLMLAAANNNEELVESLLEKGANPQLDTESGESAVSCAAENGSVECLQRLLTEKTPMSKKAPKSISIAVAGLQTMLKPASKHVRDSSTFEAIRRQTECINILVNNARLRRRPDFSYYCMKALEYTRANEPISDLRLQNINSEIKMLLCTTLSQLSA